MVAIGVQVGGRRLDYVTDSTASQSAALDSTGCTARGDVLFGDGASPRRLRLFRARCGECGGRKVEVQQRDHNG